jgi:phage shock protein A
MPQTGGRWQRLLKRSVDVLFTPPPDPRKEYLDVHQRQRALLAQVRQALTQLERMQAVLQARADAAGATVDRLLREAWAHLQAGRDDLARRSLQRRQTLLEEMHGVAGQLGEVDQEVGRLTLVEQRLASRMEALQTRQAMIEARYSAAEAQVKIQEALAGVSDDLRGLGLDLELAEAQTGRLQARAQAIDRLVEIGALESPGGGLGNLAEPRRTPAEVDAAVEQELDALKRKLALGGADAGRL